MQRSLHFIGKVHDTFLIRIGKMEMRLSSCPKKLDEELCLISSDFYVVYYQGTRTVLVRYQPRKSLRCGHRLTDVH